MRAATTEIATVVGGAMLGNIAALVVITVAASVKLALDEMSRRAGSILISLRAAPGETPRCDVARGWKR